ncbi:MAG: outer membrane protein transport protein [Candidatus Aminicenantes bacterium]|nr:outer membrane protein transport protein [Candidatus Aminicenantes bacterium]
MYALTMVRSLTRRSNRLLPSALLVVALTAGPRSSAAQLVLGQYEDEAPLRTWNVLGPVGAVSLGLGETGFALAADMTGAFVNPALLARLPKLTVTLAGSLSAAELYRFSVLNTGVLESTANARTDSTALDFGGASFRWRGWTLGISAGLTADYARPRVFYEYSSSGALLYSLSSTQAGFRRTFQASVARDLGSRLALGVGFNLSDGRLERRVEEENYGGGYSILDDKTQELRGFFLTAGLVWEPLAGLRLGAAVRTPQTLNADGQSLLQYAASPAGTLIEISAEAEDAYDEPWMAGAGLTWAIGPRLLAAADVAYFAWSDYRASYFDEPLRRDFRDIVRFGAGVQYRLPASLFGRRVLFPLRAGFVYDPQPMSAPRSAYRLLTLGTGLALDNIRLDIGLLVGSERGSGRDLAVRRVALTVSYVLAGERR